MLCTWCNKEPQDHSSEEMQHCDMLTILQDKKTNNLRFTEIGQAEGYEKDNITEAVKRVNWEMFRTDNLPFSQGSCLNTIIRECKIPISKINNMSLHGTITANGSEYNGFYGLDVSYKNGRAKIYIADCGCSCCVVADEFEPKK